MDRLRAWWDRQPDGRRERIAWLGPLAAVALAVGLDWLWRRHQGIATPPTGRTLLLRVGLVCALTAAILLLFARRWPLQRLGMVVLLAGVGGLFVRVIGRLGPQPVREPERDLIQSLLDVGAVTVMAATLLFALTRCTRWWQRAAFAAATIALGVLYAKA